MQKFEIHFPRILIGLNVATVFLSLIASYYWRAPLPYRLGLMLVILVISAIYWRWPFKKYKSRYPFNLKFTNEHWYHNEQVVMIHATSILTRHYASLCLKTPTGKKYYLAVTPKGFINKEDYYTFIRHVKIHRGSF